MHALVHLKIHISNSSCMGQVAPPPPPHTHTHTHTHTLTHIIMHSHYDRCPYLKTIFTAGNLSVMNGVHFSSEVSLNPFKYVIRCVTTGGPATTVTWTKDGSRILYDHQRQAVTSYEDSTYQHEIVLSDSVIAGEYRIDVSNGASSVSSTFCISGIQTIIVP